MKFPIWAQYLAKVFCATYGPMISAAAMLYMLFPFAHFVERELTFRNFNRILSLPYFPLQIAMGAIYGYFGRRRGLFTFSVWILPTILLFYCLRSFETSVLQDLWRARLDHFFLWECRPPECFDQMKCVAPLYTSLAYMLGGLFEGIVRTSRD